LTLAAPLLIPGGQALALKGSKIPAAEFEAAQRSLTKLGLEALELQEYRLPFTGEARLVAHAIKSQF
jgi:hypothetical protein